jgi:protein-disulfide isomerase
VKRAFLAPGAAALALLLASCGEDGNGSAGVNLQAPLTPIAAPNAGDWREVVATTPEGGTRIGNPQAPVKLVEYGSLTCPACRAFSETATARLRDPYIRSGQVSWEFRHLIIHGAPDVALALLANCRPPAAFFGTIERIYDQQPQILARFDDEEQARIRSLPADTVLVPVAEAMELGPFFAQLGLPGSRFQQCLADRPAAQRLADVTNRAMTLEGVGGTPTFFVIGERLTVTAWSDLEPILRQRIGG